MLGGQAARYERCMRYDTCVIFLRESSFFPPYFFALCFVGKMSSSAPEFPMSSPICMAR